MENKSLIVGVTGGIGSGKTTVCALLQNLGFPIFYADLESKLLCDRDTNLKHELKRAFGNGIYNSEGKLNKPLFASIIFSDIEKLDTANKIIHPAVRNAFHNWVLVQKSPIVFIESAILLQSVLQNSVDRVLLVSADVQTRVKRVIKRDSTTEQQVLERISKQQSEEININKAHYIIVNDNNELLIPKVEQFIKELQLL